MYILINKTFIIYIFIYIILTFNSVIYGCIDYNLF